MVEDFLDYIRIHSADELLGNCGGYFAVVDIKTSFYRINNKQTLNYGICGAGYAEVVKKCFQRSKRSSVGLTTPYFIWRPQADLNRCCRRERPVSWTWLDDGDVI